MDEENQAKTETRERVAATLATEAHILLDVVQILQESAKSLREEPEPPPPPPPPEEPDDGLLLGLDLSDNNKIVLRDFFGDAERKALVSLTEALAAEPYDIVCLRVIGGLNPGHPSGLWIDGTAKRRIAALKQPRFGDVIKGLYAFPVRASFVPLDVQVDTFIKMAGGPHEFVGKFVMLDYEEYAPNPAATIPPQGLQLYIKLLRDRLGPIPIIIYSGKTFWESPPHSGLLSHYGENVHLWNAWWWNSGFVQDLELYYRRNVEGSGYWVPYGGSTPMMAQITPNNNGFDGNIFRGTRRDFDKYLIKSVKPAPPDPDPDPEPEPQPDPGPPIHPEWLTGPLHYLRQCMGGPYVKWSSGRFTETAPAWVRNAQIGPPSSFHVRNLGAFCIAAQNLPHAYNGIYPPDDVGAWYGGVWWCTQHYPKIGVSRPPLEVGETYPLGALIIWPYRGAALGAQGHGAVKVGDDEWASWDMQKGGNIRTFASLLHDVMGGDRRFFWVHPIDWLKPRRAGETTVVGGWASASTPTTTTTIGFADKGKARAEPWCGATATAQDAYAEAAKVAEGASKPGRYQYGEAARVGHAVPGGVDDWREEWGVHPPIHTPSGTIHFSGKDNRWIYNKDAGEPDYTVPPSGEVRLDTGEKSVGDGIIRDNEEVLDEVNGRRKKRRPREPVISWGSVMGFIASALAVAVAFGVDISNEQVHAILTFAAAAVPIGIGLFAIRSKVTPVRHD